MCPRCQQEGLYATGAFWRCRACGLAITQQALRVEQARGLERGEGEPPRDTVRSAAKPSLPRGSLPA